MINHPCPLLRKIYDMLLDEWYADQHFDSPVLDQLRQIERECGVNGNGYIVVAEFENLIMNIEREVKVRDAIKYCIENFDSQTATNRIVEFWKDELKLQEQQCNIANVVGRSEQLKPKEQICYKSNEPCKYDCSGLCKESC